MIDASRTSGIRKLIANKTEVHKKWLDVVIIISIWVIIKMKEHHPSVITPLFSSPFATPNHLPQEVIQGTLSDHYHRNHFKRHRNHFDTIVWFTPTVSTSSAKHLPTCHQCYTFSTGQILTFLFLHGTIATLSQQFRASHSSLYYTWNQCPQVPTIYDGLDHQGT